LFTGRAGHVEDSYRWWVLATVSTSMLMVGLDLSILAASLPHLARVFHTDSSVIGWVNILYFIVSLSLTLTLAKVGDALGRKKIFLTGLGIYCVGLTVASLSQSVGQLLIARAIQGSGGAMTVALATAITVAAFPPEERGKVVGILTGVSSVGLVAGPMVGGFLLDLLSWRGIFYTRVPVLLACLLLSWRIIKEPTDGKRLAFRLDIWGSLALFGWLSAFLLYLGLGRKIGFLSVRGIALAASAVVCFVLFILIEKRAFSPIVDLRLFKKPVFSASIVSSMATTVGSSSAAFLFPFYLMNGLGFSGSGVGSYMALLAIPAVILSPLAGRASDRIGSRALSTAGVAIGCIGVFALSRLGPAPTGLSIAIALFIAGSGMGIFHPPNTSALIGTVSKDMLGVASAMAMMARNVGTSVAVALSGTIFSLYESRHLASLQRSGTETALAKRLASVGGFHDALIIALFVAMIGIITSLIKNGSPIHTTGK
jgi:EmrB/QacA subfamily drug resistance transporter